MSEPQNQPAERKEGAEVPKKRCVPNIEKDYETLPPEMKCQIFKQMSNFEVIGFILSSEKFDDTAGDVLKMRMVHLESLKLLHAPNHPKRMLLSVCARELPIRDTDGRRGKTSNFKMAFDADVDLLVRVADGDASAEMRVHHAEKKEANLWRHLARVVHTILTHFNCSRADIHLGGDGVNKRMLWHSQPTIRNESVTPFPIDVTLAQPRIESSKKIDVSRVVLTNTDLAPLLHWIRPRILDCQIEAKQLYDKDGHLMIDGVHSVQFNGAAMPEYIVDDVIEKCSASEISLYKHCIWTQESINRVLTANAITKSGDIRAINLHTEEPETDWKQMFDAWVSSFEATHGEDAPKRAYCTDNSGSFKYRLY